MKAYPLVDHMTTAERFDFEKENTIRLRRELNIGLNRILAHTEKDILLVLDRSEISGYFWLKKLFSSLTFEEYLSFKDSKGHSTEIIKPDMIFALQVSILILQTTMNYLKKLYKLWKIFFLFSI